MDVEDLDWPAISVGKVDQCFMVGPGVYYEIDIRPWWRRPFWRPRARKLAGPPVVQLSPGGNRIVVLDE